MTNWAASPIAITDPNTGKVTQPFSDSSLVIPKNVAQINPVVQAPYRLASWGQERASFESNQPELIGNTRFTNIRSGMWLCAFRGDMVPAADYGILSGSTGIRAIDWNNTARTEGKTFASLSSKANSIDAVLFNYGGTDIVAGNGTTPTAATVLGYLQANILAILRLGIPVIVESIYPYMDTALYRGVGSGWTAAGSGTGAQKQAICDSVNSRLQAWLLNFPGQAIFVDVATPLKDSGSFLSKKYAIDGIELNLRGAALVGKLVAEASKALLPLRQSHYIAGGNWVTQEAIALLPSGFTNYNLPAATNGTVNWGTPSVGFDAKYGPYFEVVGTCSAITGTGPINITNVTWANGFLTFTATSHKMIPTQKIITSGLTGSIAGAITGPFSVADNTSETTFTVAYPTDPGTITIAGIPPSASSQITLYECYTAIWLFSEYIKQNGTPATGVQLSSSDMLESSAWIYADDNANGIPPLASVTLRQRLYFNAGTSTPNPALTDAGIFQPITGEPSIDSVFGPVRLVTPKMVASNTAGGGSANISNAIAPNIQIGVVFNALGAARFRIYSPSMRVVQPGPIVLATPATGVAYVNKYPFPMRVVMGLNGATVSAATVDRGDANSLYTLGASFLTGGEITLAPNDRLILTYTVATPTLTGFVP